ncbi:MAG: zinc ABC transporter substrate-binding protein [Chromatiaceae bacterium]|jgi:zinc transport system substrate-binding protein
MQKLLLLLILSLAPTVGFAEPLRVFASVVPIQTFVEKIGGQHVDARAMVRPGFNPHTYDPTPQQISALAGAALYVRTGVPFEKAWMARIRSANPGMQVFDVRDGIALRELGDHDHDERGKDAKHRADADHAHEGHPADAAHDDHEKHDVNAAKPDHDQAKDPHVWTSPSLVRDMIGRIRDKLTELAPAHAGDFARNHDAFATELKALDRELHTLLDPLPNRRFMVFHPAWGYFADSYGLTQVPIEREGKEPGARALAALIDQAKKDKIKVVFVQPQFDKRQARQVAQAIGGVVIAVDPLAADYVDNLRRVGREFAQALQP